MCKEIKRLTELSQCPHLNKTDRDAITYLLRETGNIVVEVSKGFDGFNFSSWPDMPSKTLIKDWVSTRKSKGKTVITQTFIDSCAQSLHSLKKQGVTVDESITYASNGGWQGFREKWVLDEKEKEKSTNDLDFESNTPASWVKRVDLKQVTSRSQIPKEVRLMIDTYYRLGKYKPETMAALTNIGFAV